MTGILQGGPQNWDVQNILSLIQWLLFSAALFLLLKKLRWKRRWMAWVPGFRYLALAGALDMGGEGLVCGLLDVLLIATDTLDLYTMSDRVKTALALALLIALIALGIYRIRIYLRLIRVFSLRKRWLWLFISFEWLAMLLLARRDRWQPVGLAREDCAPAVSAGASPGEARADSGLYIDLRERTVTEGMVKRRLLRDIRLEIPNGSLVLLLGGSGAGKTTFVNAMIGYEKADADVILNGMDVYRDYAQMKYRIGFVPQQNLMRGSDTVYHTVMDAAQLRLPVSAPRDSRSGKVREVMELLGLESGADGLVSKKSGGQLRRVSIAMELVTDPELFVLDEPDSGLDGVIAREIFTRLRGIADEGKIVLVITHTPDRVVDLFDKVIVLAKDSAGVGRLAFYGSPQEARDFFNRDTMEGVVMSVNRKEEGGDGLADRYVEQYARRRGQREEVGA